GWSGEDVDRISGTDGSYSLEMSGDSQLEIEVELLEFKLLSLQFDDVLEADYEDGDVIDVPYNLDELTLEFNNEVNEANEVAAEIKAADEDGEVIEPNDIEIEDNYIHLSFGEIYEDISEQENLDFGEKYTLQVAEKSDDHIFDVRNREIEGDVQQVFLVEEPIPDVPQNVVLEKRDGEIEISWLRSSTNTKVDNDEYVQEYRIYRYTDEGQFDPENPGDHYDVKEVENTGKKIISYFDELTETDYIYRISAYNTEFENESRLSEPVSTD
ncbi:MAG: hypothetical protein ACQEQG_08695, partial [Bacillota bacterium]